MKQLQFSFCKPGAQIYSLKRPLLSMQWG